MGAEPGSRLGERQVIGPGAAEPEGPDWGATRGSSWDSWELVARGDSWTHASLWLRGCRCTMSRLGTLGGARAGLGLLLGTAAGLGFLCVLYSRRWRRTQRRGRSQSLPHFLDYEQTSEPGCQGTRLRPRSLLTDGPGFQAVLGRACGTGQRRGCFSLERKTIFIFYTLFL